VLGRSRCVCLRRPSWRPQTKARRREGCAFPLPLSLVSHARLASLVVSPARSISSVHNPDGVLVEEWGLPGKKIKFASSSPRRRHVRYVPLTVEHSYFSLSHHRNITLSATNCGWRGRGAASTGPPLRSVNLSLSLSASNQSPGEDYITSGLRRDSTS